MSHSHLIDHVCLLHRWVYHSTVELAERVNLQGRRPSDHPTVTVEMDLSPADRRRNRDIASSA